MKYLATLLVALFQVAAAQAQDFQPAQPVAGTHQCAYPKSEMLSSESGTTTVRYDVDATGGIANVTVHRSSGHPLLDQAAVACVEQDWRELPAMRNGQPIADPGHLANVAFQLIDNPQAASRAGSASGPRAGDRVFDAGSYWLPALVGAAVLILALVIAITILLGKNRQGRHAGGD
jgi:TonB family protein